MAAPTNHPVKGILKNSSSFDQAEHQHPKPKGMKWDEMNIIATYHPENKDYGHMKIDDPPTPYHAPDEMEQEDDLPRTASESSACGSGAASNVCMDNVADRLQDPTAEPRVLQQESEESDDEAETDEQRAARRQFEQKRKQHYNEFQAVKLARQLMEEDDEEPAAPSQPAQD